MAPVGPSAQVLPTRHSLPAEQAAPSARRVAQWLLVKSQNVSALQVRSLVHAAPAPPIAMHTLPLAPKSQPRPAPQT